MARKKKRRLGVVTESDVITAAVAVETYCPTLYKTKQYIPICKSVAGKFVDEIASRGTSPRAIADTANTIEAWCGSKFKTPQYSRVCTAMTGNMVRAISKQEGRREGRVFKTLEQLKREMRAGLEGRRR